MGRISRAFRSLDSLAARLLLFSKAAVPAISVYPDSDAIGVWPDDDTEFYFKRSTSVSRDEAV